MGGRIVVEFSKVVIERLSQVIATKGSARFIVLFAACLSSCATNYDQAYRAKTNISQAEAVAVIEQVLYEQGIKYRPQSVLVTSQYIAMDFGRQQSSQAGFAIPVGSVAIALGDTKTISEAAERIYFDSIDSLKPFSRNRYYGVTIFHNGRLHKHVYTYQKHKAERLVDALNYFIQNSRKGGFGQ